MSTGHLHIRILYMIIQGPPNGNFYPSTSHSPGDLFRIKPAFGTVQRESRSSDKHKNSSNSCALEGREVVLGRSPHLTGIEFCVEESILPYIFLGLQRRQIWIRTSDSKRGGEKKNKPKYTEILIFNSTLFFWKLSLLLGLSILHLISCSLK